MYSLYLDVALLVLELGLFGLAFFALWHERRKYNDGIISRERRLKLKCEILYHGTTLGLDAVFSTDDLMDYFEKKLQNVKSVGEYIPGSKEIKIREVIEACYEMITEDILEYDELGSFKIKRNKK